MKKKIIIIPLLLMSLNTLASNQIFSVFVNGKYSIGEESITPPEPEMQNVNFISFSCGKEHCLGLTDKNEVFASGTNNNGQLGENNGESTKEWIKTSLKDVCQIATGNYHSLALHCDKKTMSVAGTNFKNELGIVDVDKVLKWRKVGFPFGSADYIEAGGYNTFVISNKKLYAIGANTKGQLGTGNKMDYDRWAFVFDNVKKIDTSGNDFSMLLTYDNKLYGTGVNRNGELGIGNQLDQSSWKLTATHINDFDLSAYSALAIQNGVLLGTGGNGNCELGLGTCGKKINWTTISTAQNVKKVIMNKYSNGSYYINKSGELYYAGHFPYLGLAEFNSDIKKWTKVKIYPNETNYNNLIISFSINSGVGFLNKKNYAMGRQIITGLNNYWREIKVTEEIIEKNK